MNIISYLEGNHTSKNILIFILPFVIIFSRAFGDIFIIFTSLAFLYHCIKNDFWSWVKRPWILTTLFLWCYCCLIVSYFAYDPIQSFLYSLAFIRWPLFGAALSYWLLKDQEQQNIFQLAILLLVIFIIGDTIYQYYSGADIFGQVSFSHERLSGPFNKLVPGTFVLRIVFIACSAIYFIPASTKEKYKVYLIIPFIFITIGFIFLTGERIALLCMISASIVILFYLFKFHKREFVPFIILVVLGISSLLFFISHHPKMIQRSIVSSITQTQNWSNSPYGQTTIAAFLIWKNTNLWTGVGINNYRLICNDKSIDQIVADYPDRVCQHPHNFYIEWLVSGGPVALFCFILILSFIIREILYQDSYKMKKVFSLVTIFVSFWPFMSSMSIFSNWIASIMWMTIGWCLVSTHTSKPVKL